MYRLSPLLIYTLLIYTLLILGCASPVAERVTDISRQAAIRGAATAIRLECGSLFADIAADNIRAEINAELKRQGSSAKTTPPDCGKSGDL